MKKSLEILVSTLAGLALMAIMVLTFLDVSGRKILSHSITGSLELTELLMVVVIFGALPLVSLKGEHVVFDLVWNSVGPRVRRAMRIAGHLMIGSLAAIALPGSWDYVRFMAREGTPVLGLSFQWVFLPFVLLLLALVVRSAWGIWDAWRGRGLQAQELPS